MVILNNIKWKLEELKKLSFDKTYEDLVDKYEELNKQLVSLSKQITDRIEKLSGRYLSI